MSRSYEEHHKMLRGIKYPSPFRDNSGFKERHRKIKPYGSVGYCGYGGEIYIKKWGYILLDCIKKRQVRNLNKVKFNKIDYE